jgi:hypothetical protein
LAVPVHGRGFVFRLAIDGLDTVLNVIMILEYLERVALAPLRQRPTNTQTLESNLGIDVYVRRWRPFVLITAMCASH